MSDDKKLEVVNKVGVLITQSGLLFAGGNYAESAQRLRDAADLIISVGTLVAP